MKGSVDRGVVHSTYYVTKQPFAPRDIISNAPTVNTINRPDISACTYYIVNLIQNTCQYISLTNRFQCFPNVFRYNTAALRPLPC